MGEVFGFTFPRHENKKRSVIWDGSFLLIVDVVTWGIDRGVVFFISSLPIQCHNPSSEWSVSPPPPFSSTVYPFTLSFPFLRFLIICFYDDVKLPLLLLLLLEGIEGEVFPFPSISNISQFLFPWGRKAASIIVIVIIRDWKWYSPFPFFLIVYIFHFYDDVNLPLLLLSVLEEIGGELFFTTKGVGIQISR